MNKINFLTAGESHGNALVGIVEGIPAVLSYNEEYINTQLSRRQKGSSAEMERRQQPQPGEASWSKTAPLCGNAMKQFPSLSYFC